MKLAQFYNLSVPQLQDLRQEMRDEKEWRQDGDHCARGWIRRLSDELLDDHILMVNDRIAAINTAALDAMLDRLAKSDQDRVDRLASPFADYASAIRRLS